MPIYRSITSRNFKVPGEHLEGGLCLWRFHVSPLPSREPPPLRGNSPYSVATFLKRKFDNYTPDPIRSTRRVLILTDPWGLPPGYFLRGQTPRGMSQWGINGYRLWPTLESPLYCTIPDPSHWSAFKAHQHTDARYWYTIPSVCLSVCPFVRPSHSGIRWKRLNTLS